MDKKTAQLKIKKIVEKSKQLKSLLFLAKDLVELNEKIENINDINIDKIVKDVLSKIKAPKDGKDYIITDNDIKKISSLIKVPVVKQIVEKRTVVEKPIVNNIIKEVAKEIDYEELRDKLENIKKGQKLSINAIEELPKIIESIYKDINKLQNELSKKSSAKISGRTYKFTDDETPVNSGDDTNFSLRKAPVEGSLKLYRNGARQKLTEDYTLVHKTITLVTPLQSPSEILLADYRHY